MTFYFLLQKELPQELDFYEKGSFLNFIIYLFLTAVSTNTVSVAICFDRQYNLHLQLTLILRRKWHILNMNDRFFSLSKVITVFFSNFYFLFKVSLLQQEKQRQLNRKN
jgi:hypothetical protein